MNKIFQSFFTTKPTRQGTGLGLSLTHDIIKLNDGDITVEKKAGENGIYHSVANERKSVNELIYEDFKIKELLKL